RIVRVDAKGAFAGYLEPRGGTSAVTPAAFKLDASDNAYVLDLAGKRVVVVAPDGKVERELPLPHASGIMDVAVDASGWIYILDAVWAILFAAEKRAKSFEPLGARLTELISFPTYLTADRG